MSFERVLIVVLLAASILVLTRGLWSRKRKKSCGSCSGCGCGS